MLHNISKYFYRAFSYKHILAVWYNPNKTSFYYRLYGNPPPYIPGFINGYGHKLCVIIDLLDELNIEYYGPIRYLKDRFKKRLRAILRFLDKKIR